ncbi:MAG: hypothetical protein AAF821_18375 [Cyanobacteria bacterium P01_D01_bin.156]
MKAPVVFSSLLALAGTTITAERAEASIPDAETINGDLKTAMCDQDWYQAIKLSSRLIVSPNVSPDYQKTLMEWRNHFYSYAKGNQKTDEIPSCGELSARSIETVQNFSSPAPQFSSTFASPVSSSAPRSSTDSFIRSSSSGRSPNNLWTVGVRAEGNRIRGKLLNNGWNNFRNVTLTLRSRKVGHSTNVRTVAIDTVRAWSETEFVASFPEAPGSWFIETIEVN